jgi:tape measure domain-containing protein
MAMSLDTAIKFTAKLEGQGLDQLKRSLQGLTQQSNVSKRSLDNLYTATKALGSSSGNTIAGLQKTAVALRALRDQAEFGSRKFKLLSKDLESVEQRLKKFQNTAEKGGGLSRGGAALAGFAGGIAGSIAASALGSAQQAVTGVASVGLAAETAQARIRALSNEFGEYNQVQASVARIATTLRLSNTEAADSFASLYASLRPTGITVEELEKAFIGFSAAARNSGATAQETSNALIQLKQGLASGVLQGEELRSIREQAPLAAQAIAQELGVSIGELKNLAAEGKVTTDVVLSALGKLQDTQLGKLNQQFNTGQQAIKDFQVASEELGKTLSRIFGPTAVALLRNFTGVLRDATDILGSITGDGDAGRRAQLRVEAQQKAARETDQRFGAFSFDLGGKNQFFLKRQQEIYQELLAADQKRDQQQTLSGDQREAREAAAAEREAARQRARKEALEDELKIRKDTEEKLGDAAQRRAEQLADFQRETAKRAAALERDLGDERLKIERQIADTRTKLQAVIEDRQLEAERQRLAAAGLSTEGIDTAREVKEIFRRYDQQRIENDRNAVDAQTDLQRRLEEYKISVAEGIGKIQEGYARSVSNILQDAGEKLAEKMRQGAQDAATTLGGAGGGAPGALGPNQLMPGSVGRGQLKVGQLKALAMAAGFNDRDASIMAAIAMAESGGRSAAHNNNAATGDNSYGLWQVNMLGRMGPERRRSFGIGSNEALFDPAVNASAARKVFESQGFGAWSVFKSGAYRQYLPAAMRAQAGAPPAPMLPGAAGAAGALPAGVQQAGGRLDAALNESKRQQQLLNEQQTLAALEQKYGAITEALSSQQEVAANKLRDELRYAELLRNGISPELARQRVELEATAAIEQTKLLALEAELQAKIATLPVESSLRQELEKQVEVIEQRLNLQGQVVDKTMALTEAERKANDERERQERTIDAIANSIGSGLGQVFDLLASGTDDWAESLKGIASGVLKDIAKQLFQIYVIEAAIKALKGFLSGGTDAAGNSVPNLSGFANGGIMTSSGPAPLKKYSQGGIANRPQLALYGEGSKPEAYVPLPDGRRIPVALQGQDKMREVMGAGPAQGATSPVLNMSFQTTSIGGVEYVSRDQLEAAMAETRRAASRDGAKRGMTMTLDKLQQSPSTRTRVGLR